MGCAVNVPLTHDGAMIVLLIILAVNGILGIVVVANVVGWPRIRPLVDQVDTSVSVLIPARNEEENLPSCLDAALAQGGSVSEILVYNDHSDDRTAEIVRQYADHDPRIRLVPPVPLPAGWCGKPFACQQLADHARKPWLLFIDADVRLTPGAICGMVDAAERYGATFLSAWPGLDLVSVWEKVLMPMLNFVVFTLFPAPLSLVRNDPSLGLAHGASILVRGDMYRKIGGHSSVRNQLFEDTALARQWRARGQRGICLDGQDVVRVRMYRSLGDIWVGFQKNFFPAFRHGMSFWMFLVLHFAVFFLPLVLLVLPGLDADIRTIAAVGAAFVFGMRVMLNLRFRYPWWSVLFHPLAELFLVALGLTSWWNYRIGGGVVWKERFYRSSSLAGERKEP